MLSGEVEEAPHCQLRTWLLWWDGWSWGLADDPLPEALVDVLAALEPAEIVDFYVKYVEVEDSAYQYSLCMAAYLIEGSYSNDGFKDFRGGLILLGRDTFSRVVENPDFLADLPTVTRMSREEGGWIGYECVSYLSRLRSEAWLVRTSRGVRNGTGTPKMKSR